MIQDARSFPPDFTLHTDVCVVGAGPAGIALANELTNSSLDVMVLEGGGTKVESTAQALNAGESVGITHREYQAGRVRAFGGTAKRWAGQCLRLDKIDFEPRDWVPDSGWPFDLAAFEPYYQRAETFFGVGGQAYDESNYRSFGIDRPEWASGSIESRFTVYTPFLDTGQAFFGSFRKAHKLRVLLHANVTQIETCESGDSAVAVRVRTLEGKVGRVSARAFVVAGGAIENARLLLASHDRRSRGLGNDHDLVGRFFQDHPTTFAATIEGGDPIALQQKFRLLYRRRHRYFPKFALSSLLQRQNEVLNSKAHLVFEYPEHSGLHAMREIYRSLRQGHLPEKTGAHARSVLRDYKEVAAAVVNRTRGKSAPCGGAAVRLQCHLEQAPNRNSRIQLSERRDMLGMPTIKVDWQMTGLERKTLQTMTQTVASEFKRLQFGEVHPESWVQNDDLSWQDNLRDCAHHMGTTRMADSPLRGVVDHNCRVFGLKGLYIAGSSTFPTSGYANPTLTIVALAIRLADHLSSSL